MYIPDHNELMATYNRQVSEQNIEGITPDLTAKAGKVFMLFNKEIQGKMRYVKSLSLAATAVENVISQIVTLDYDSIIVEIVPSSIRFVMNFKERGLTFEIDILHHDYQASTYCRVILHLFEVGKASHSWPVEMADILTKINRELL